MNYSKFYSSTLLFAGSLLIPIYADNDTVEKISEGQTNLVATEPKEAKPSLTRLTVRQSINYIAHLVVWSASKEKKWTIPALLIDLVLRIGTIYCCQADFEWTKEDLYKHGSNIFRTLIFWSLFLGTEIITGNDPIDGTKNATGTNGGISKIIKSLISPFVVSLVWHYFIELIDHFIVAIFIPYEETKKIKTPLKRLAVRESASYMAHLLIWMYVKEKKWTTPALLIDLALRIGTIYCYRADFEWAKKDLYKYGSNIFRTLIFCSLFFGTKNITHSNLFNEPIKKTEDTIGSITIFSCVSLVWHYFIELIDHFIIAIFIPYEEATEVKKEEQEATPLA